MLLTLDLETFWGTKYSLTSFTYEEYIKDPRFSVHCCGIKINENPTYVIWGPQYEGGKDIRAHIQGLIDKAHADGEEITAVCHNAAFDGSILYWHYGLRFDMVICTQRMAAACWPHESTALWTVAKRCKAGRKGKELVNSKDVVLLDDAQRKLIDRYCANDVEITFKSLMYMNKFIPNDELRIISDTLHMFLNRPLRVDRPALEEFKRDEIQARIDAILAAQQIDSTLTEKILASGNKFAAWIISKGMDFKQIPSPTRNNPDNTKWPLGKDSDEFKLLRVEHPEFKDVFDAKISISSNINITRAGRILDHSDRCPSNPDGAMGFLLNTYGAGNTLRWAGGNRCNGQNLRKGTALRTALEAPDGFVVTVLDQSNIEARVLAWLAQETQLLDGFRNEVDLYCQFASTVYDRPITKKDKTERFVGKTCILGLGYQMGAARLRVTLALGAMGPAVFISHEEARRLVMKYRTRYKAITNLWHEAAGVLQMMITMETGEVDWRGLKVRNSSIVLPNNMVLSYPQIKNSIDEDTGDSQVVYKGKSYWVKIFPGKLIENIIQALSRVIIASNTLGAKQILADIDSDGQLALLVHDEIVAVVEEDKAQEYLDKLTVVMRTPPPWCSKGGLTLDAEGGYAKNYSK